LLTGCGAVPSTSEATRVIQQGGVEVDGEVVRDREHRLSLDREHRLRVGKRRFFRVSSPQKPV
jgi:tyrosyl-tRNA synthetase